MQAISYRGLQVHLGSRAEALASVQNFLMRTGQHQVITLNPEFVVLAKHLPALAPLTHRASLCLVDGIGLALAVKRFGRHERYPGADLVPDLLRFCVANQKKVGVVLPLGGLSSAAQVVFKLTEQFPGLCIAAWEEATSLAAEIQQFQPELLLVTFGQPRQDLWIAERLAALPSVRLAIGVGGAIDFLTGTRRRAPRLMRNLGVEWLWRLCTQPRRFARILRATFGFWYTILFQ